MIKIYLTLVLQMSASKPKESISRILKNVLNKSEQEFVAGRRNTVLQTLNKLKIQCSQKEVPNIALLGSGGAQRAMVGLLGSLVQLDKAGLLDCILYLSGVSGSTWCMASLYKEPNWSTKLETVKEKIIERLSGPGVSLTDAMAKLKKYYYGKDFFSLTDVWAVLVVTSYVKEIDERTLTEQRKQHNKDPFPIYAVIDKQSKQSNDGDPWFEISPHEAGYSLTGAFVDTCDFGSQFDNGLKKKHQDEMDMLYLQAMCSSALADGEATWKWIKAISVPEIKSVLDKMDQGKDHTGGNASKTTQEPVGEDECYQELLNPVDADPSALEQSSKTKLTDFFRGQRQFGQTADKHKKTARCITQRIWGRNYNFLHNMTDESVPAALLQKETRDLIDAGLLINSPYLSMLRKERNIDLFIALDFSDGDPFTTVREAAKTCKKLNIPFPEVNVPSDEGKKPKDFYVFKGQNVPTVIHMPLFNVVNCGDKPGDWRKKYGILKGPYSAEMITEVMGVAGKNISNNIEKLLEEIRAVAEAK
uniref:PLA2c domain-containing protein n=1 Tax=Cyprinus carpio TaxID=7962 RepID=A0A8C1PV38_CYPCA